MSAISRGATRNLLLQKIPPNLSEARIREDLDHIHNLHVEKVEIRGSTAYVNLNSICVALFARTCLMSRSSYKGIKIEFAADDCSVSLPIAKRKPPMGPEKEQKVTPKNRFDILASVSGNEDEDSSDDETERENSDGDRRTAIGAEFGDSASFLNGINSYAWGDTVNGF